MLLSLVSHVALLEKCGSCGDGTTECIDEANHSTFSRKGFAQRQQSQTRDVLHDLASNKLKLVYPQLAHLASLGITIPFSITDCSE